MKTKNCFIYIWYDRKHKRYYIGSHFKGHENDGYICSSPWMKQGYKHRPNDFKRRILQRMHCTHKELLEQEEKWLQKAEKKKERYYNLTFTVGHWASDEKIKKSVGQRCSERQKSDPNWASWNKGIIRSEETKEKIKIARAKQIITEETKQKISQSLSGENNHFFGKKHTDATKELNRQKHLGKVVSQETREKLRVKMIGNKNTLGRKHSEETKRKMRESHAKRKVIA